MSKAESWHGRQLDFPSRSKRHSYNFGRHRNPMNSGYVTTTNIADNVDLAVFFEKDTSTLSYIVFDRASKDAVIIDPVLDYDPASGVVSETSVGILMDFISSELLHVVAILETHAHADHLSGSHALKKRLPEAKITIGSRITDVQQIFKNVYGFEDWFVPDGRQFDTLVKDGETFRAGTLKFKAVNTSGHTPACSTWIVNGKVAFVGDSIFIPDSGTGRCDFPGGSADQLYDSITQKIYTLPDHTRLFVGHDYQPGGRPLRFETTVYESKTVNIQLSASTSKEQYIEFRTKRDKTLSAPRLIHQSVQVNINGGHIPPADAAGRQFLKIPVKQRS